MVDLMKVMVDMISGWKASFHTWAIYRYYSCYGITGGNMVGIWTYSGIWA